MNRSWGSLLPRVWGTRIPRLRLVLGFLLVSQITVPSEPLVRIGIGRNLSSLRVDSTEPFEIEGVRVRTARFSTIVTLPLSSTDAVSRDELETRIAVDIGEDQLFIRPLTSRIEIVPGAAPLEFNGRSWRGMFEVIGRDDGNFTLVNQLLLEDYLLGVVPNELGPEAFPELEAIKAQAIAARTYVIRNLGQFEAEGYDICATDQCQVYFGLDTEHPVATMAVEETRGQIATWEGEPINALYSSTCGGRTEDAENVFGASVPYLVSVECLYEHPEPQEFHTTTVYDSWEAGLLGIAGGASLEAASRFLGVEVEGKPPDDPDEMASFIKEHFYPDIPADSPRLFLEEQGIFRRGGENRPQDLILRLLLEKGAFEWRDARLISWDGEILRVRVGQGIRELELDPGAPIFLGLGDSRVPVNEGVWVGGEFMQLRVVDEVVQALVYEPVSGGVPSADRYSPLAHWESRKTRTELGDAVQGLGIGDLEDIVILERGESGRVVRAELDGTRGTAVLTGPRLRTLFGLRDSLVYIEQARNSRRQLISMTFFGGGWGHGVGMCQVGAFGMAMDGASAEEILKTYYTGIDIEKVY